MTLGNSILQPYRGLLINVSSFCRALGFHLVLSTQLAEVPNQKLMGIPCSSRIMWLGGAEHPAALFSHLHRKKPADFNCLNQRQRNRYWVYSESLYFLKNGTRKTTNARETCLYFLFNFNRPLNPNTHHWFGGF